ncbi:MAG: hypothetical protein PHD03_00830 [Bacilli bacterium]|nr:hypothetical protein [Bacilli bacterium]MDD4406811.1 hypothetical protein [Bacilli bacterium]
MHKVNDVVVYIRDVCKISEVDNKNKYYTLIPINDKSLTIKIPFNNDKVRGLISKKEVEAIIKKIPQIELIDFNNDKMVEHEYKKLLYSNEHENLIKIIKTTHLRNQDRINHNKKVSEKDSNYFNLAEKLLYNEFAAVLGKTYDETKDYVINEVNKINSKKSKD